MLILQEDMGNFHGDICLVTVKYFYITTVELSYQVISMVIINFQYFFSSPAPPGHYPDELATTGPMGLSSWDDVRVRYEYYKGRGYLRDLNLEVSTR